MNLKEFIGFNKTCPICNNKLTMYMQWINGPLFKANKKHGNYFFQKILNSDRNKLTNPHGDLFILNAPHYDNTISEIPEMRMQALRHQMYFIFMCQQDGIQKVDNQYLISAYYACYFRSTPILNLEQSVSMNFKFTTVNPDESQLSNIHESFTLTNTNEKLKKVYSIKLDYAAKETVLWFYTITPEQEKDDNYEPNVFEKAVPLLPVRPKFDHENKEALFKRLDSWILLS